MGLWVGRLDPFNHAPHFPHFATHFADAMPTACGGGDWVLGSTAHGYSPLFPSFPSISPHLPIFSFRLFFPWGKRALEGSACRGGRPGVGNATELTPSDTPTPLWKIQKNLDQDLEKSRKIWQNPDGPKNSQSRRATNPALWYGREGHVAR